MAKKVNNNISYKVTQETAALLKSMQDFNKALNAAESSLDSLNTKLTGTAKATKDFFSILDVVAAVNAAVTKIATETLNAEQAQIQLAGVLKSTGQNAGWTVEQLNDMADAMSKKSTFSPVEITRAQTQLLSAGDIEGEMVPGAVQASIDMSARLNTSLTESAEAIGKALSKPSEAMQTLGLQGVKFGEDQVALAQKLEATGDTAQAQALLLAGLSSAYGGAGEAARDSFGGAIAALENQLNDLLAADGGGLGGATSGVNDLTAALGSNETKAAFNAITGWVLSFVGALASASANVVRFLNSGEKIALLLGTDQMSRAKNSAENYGRQITNLTNKAIQMQEEIDLVSKDILAEGKNPKENEWVKTHTARLIEMRRQIVEVAKKAQDASQELKNLANLGTTPKTADSPKLAKDSLPASREKDAAVTASSGGDASPRGKPTRPIVVQGNQGNQGSQGRQGRQGSQGSQGRADDNAAATPNYLNTLQQQSERVDQMSVAERLQYDIDKKNVVLSPPDLEKAKQLAQTIDAMKKADQDRLTVAGLQTAELSAQREVQTQIDSYGQNLAGMTMSDRQVQDAQARKQVLETYQSRIRSLEDQQRQALATASPDKEEAIKQQYADLIIVQQDYQTKALAEWEKYVFSRNAMEGDWITGAQKAYANYVASAGTAATQAQSLFEKSAQGMEDALVTFAMTGKLSFKDLANSIIADIIRAQMRAAVSGLFGSLMNAIGGGWQPAGIQSSGAFTSGVTGPGNVVGVELPPLSGTRANGGDVSAGQMYEVTERGVPELLQVGNKQLLMMAGQSGTVTPLDTGRVNVADVPSMEGRDGTMAGAVINMKFINVPSQPEVKQTQNAGGQIDMEVIFQQLDSRASEGIASGSSATYRSLKNRFQLQG